MWRRLAAGLVDVSSVLGLFVFVSGGYWRRSRGQGIELDFTFYGPFFWPLAICLLAGFRPGGYVLPALERGVRWFDEAGALEEAKALPESGQPCQACGAPTVKRGPFKNDSYFWGCTRWKSDKSGCNAPPVWINEARA